MLKHKDNGAISYYYLIEVKLEKTVIKIHKWLKLPSFTSKEEVENKGLWKSNELSRKRAKVNV